MMDVQAHCDETSSLVEVAAVDELLPGQHKNFELDVNGVRQPGVLINYQGDFHAYLNVCPHVGVRLDAASNGVFNADGSYLICREHWALFEPETGVCISGPCPIAPLSKLVVQIKGAVVCVLPEISPELKKRPASKPL